jgi:outer membrane protein TolC
LLSDVVSAETAVSAAIFNLNLARNTASLAQVALAQLMGIDPRTPIQVADSLEPEYPVDDVAALVNKAFTQRPEIKEAQANVSSLRFALSAAKSGNAVSFSGVLGWDQHGLALPMAADRTLGLGINVSWSAYDSGLTKGRVEQAQANIVTAQAQLTTAQQSVISDVSQAYLNLMTAQQRVLTSNDEVKNAQEALKLAEGRFTSGVGVFLDVLDDENALTTALTNQVNANTTVQLSRAAFSHALFEDLIVRQLPAAN